MAKVEKMHVQMENKRGKKVVTIESYLPKLKKFSFSDES